jgi:hypothetical protein
MPEKSKQERSPVNVSFQARNKSSSMQTKHVQKMLTVGCKSSKKGLEAAGSKSSGIIGQQSKHKLLIFCLSNNTECDTVFYLIFIPLFYVFIFLSSF